MLSRTIGDVKEIVISGGAAGKSPALRQALVDALGRPATVCLEPEASLRGAALLALESLGVIEDATAVPARVSEHCPVDMERHGAYARLAGGQY